MTIIQRCHNWMYGENSRRANLIEHYQGQPQDVVGLIAPDPGRVWGVDVSGRWDGIVDFFVTKAKGGTFAIIKGMDGTVSTPYFQENRQAARDAGLLAGLYAWLYRDVNVSCISQARAVSDLQSRCPVDLPVVIDLEWTKWAGQASDPTYSDLDKWVSEFVRLGNRKPILYSAAGYMNKLGKIPDVLRAKFSAIWVANYDVISPSLPFGYAAWDFWQFTASGDASVYAPGNQGKMELDMNYWRGDRNSLYQFAGVVPDGEDTMKVIQGTAIGNVTRRKSPAGDTFVPSRYLNIGDRIEADRQDITLPQWLHLTKINDVPVVGDEWVSAGTDQKYITWKWVDVVEEPPVTQTPAPVPYTITLGDGITYQKEIITGTINPVIK